MCPVGLTAWWCRCYLLFVYRYNVYRITNTCRPTGFALVFFFILILWRLYRYISTTQCAMSVYSFVLITAWMFSGVANLWALLVMREYRLTLFRVNEELSWLGILMIVAHHYDIVDWLNVDGERVIQRCSNAVAMQQCSDVARTLGLGILKPRCRTESDGVSGLRPVDWRGDTTR